MKRVVSIALCLSLLIGAVTVRPQKTDAVILETASVVAAVAVIMTACGVTYWANSQTDAIDYLGGKIDAYLQTLEEPPATYEDWLDLHDGGALFEVLNGGIMRFGSAVANKILDFVRWFTEEEGIESGGQTVSLYENAFTYVVYNPNNFNGSINYTVNGDRITVSMDNIVTTGSFYVQFGFPFVGENAIEVIYNGNTIDTPRNAQFGAVMAKETYFDNPGGMGMSMGYVADMHEGRFGLYNYDANYYGVIVRLGCSYSRRSFSGTLDFSVTDYAMQTDIASITPSNNVTIPTVGESEAIDILPSVALDAGDTVATASDVIIDGIASEQGLTSTVEGEASGGDGSLSGVLAVLQLIYEFVVGIPQAVYGLFRDVLGRIDSNIHDIFNRLQELPAIIIDGIRDLFVPTEYDVHAFVTSIEAAFANRFGLLTYPLAAVEGFVQRFSNEDWGAPVFTWGDIKEPFSRQILIHAGSYNLADTLNSEPMRELYEVYLVVVKAGFCGAFLELCRRKYNKVISDGGAA